MLILSINRKKITLNFPTPKEGKALADATGAEKLFRWAIGYSHKEDKIFNNNGTALIVPNY